MVRTVKGVSYYAGNKASRPGFNRRGLIPDQAKYILTTSRNKPQLN
jgi:hypothetical protein